MPSSISWIILERHLGLSPSRICLFADIISSFRKMGFNGLVRDFRTSFNQMWGNFWNSSWTKIVPFPNFTHAKKKGLQEICSYFVSFVDISGIWWYELKGWPDILVYNLLLF